MKVLFIAGPLGPKYSDTYYDKFPLTKARPWLNRPNLKKYWVLDNNTKWNFNKSRRDWPGNDKYVRIDYAVGYALKHFAKKLPNVKVDVTPALKLTQKLIDNYDLVINHFLDVLIVPTIKKFELEGVPHGKLKELYNANADKIYPPVQYANTIYNKCHYYAWLKSIGLPIAPTYCIMDPQGTDEEAKMVLSQARSKKWPKMFAKPNFATDATDNEIFVPQKNQVAKMKKYIEGIKRQKKAFPGIVFQKLMADFETTTPQIRTYWIGNRLIWVIANDTDGETYKLSNRAAKKKYPTALRIAKRVNRAVSTYFFKDLPKLITRVDLGCCLKKGNKTTYFVNEIEFNPGMYAHLNGHDRGHLDVQMANQLVKVIKKFASR